MPEALIPPEAVEAAARTIYEYMSGEIGWNREGAAVRVACRDQASAALAAALPFLPQHVSPSVCCTATEQVDGHWLVEAHDHCTCGDGGPMGHEPGCGTVPLVDLAGLVGWDATVEQVRREALLSAADWIVTAEGWHPAERDTIDLVRRDLRARAAEAVDPRG